MEPRTSETHPLKIASVDTPGGGRIGMTLCPGKQDPAAMTGPWARDLLTDLTAVSGWGASALVTLMERQELERLGVVDIGKTAGALGLAWYHLPIRDVSIPAPSFESGWRIAGTELRERLRGGQSIVVHCRGGLGRTGTIAARLLIELGEAPERALQRVRTARPGAVETLEQERYVLTRVEAPLAGSGRD